VYWIDLLFIYHITSIAQNHHADILINLLNLKTLKSLKQTESSGQEFSKHNDRSGVDVCFYLSKFDSLLLSKVESKPYFTIDDNWNIKPTYITHALQKRSPSENAKWADRHSNRNPSYFGLCKFEFEEMMMIVSKIRIFIFCDSTSSSSSSSSSNSNSSSSSSSTGDRDRDREIISIPGQIFEVFCGIICAMLVFFYIGHLITQIGRSSVYCTIWKIYSFILVTLGIWSDDVVDLYEIHKLVKDHTCIFENIFVKERICSSNTTPFADDQTSTNSILRTRTNNEEYEKTSSDVRKYCDSPIEMKGDYAASLYAIVAPRATLLQVRLVD